MKEIIIWGTSSYVGNYVRKKVIPSPISGEMRILQEFLSSDVANFGTSYVIKRLIECQKDPMSKGFSMNATDLTKLSDEKIALNYEIFENLKDLIIPFEDLINIVKTWGELRAQRVPYIIIERDGEKCSIRGTDSIETT